MATDLIAGSADALRRAGSATPARGMLFVHSCPPALRPHVEWALAEAIGAPVRLTWSEQPIAPGMLRAQTGWRGAPGTAGRLAARLRDWPMIRVEITEEPSTGCDGERIAITPDLGVWRAAMSANGDVLVHEDRLRAATDCATDAEELRAAVDQLLGRPWDDELEIYRQAGAGLPTHWLSAAI